MKSDILIEAHNGTVKVLIEGEKAVCMASLSCIFKSFMDEGVFTLEELMHSLALAISICKQHPQEQAEDIIADMFKDLRNK